MKRSNIRIIIILATILFVGLVLTQIVWVQKAYQIAQEGLEHEIELALIDVVQDIQRHSGDSAFLVDPVKQVEPNFFRVQINEELQPYYLESLLKTEFLNRELNFDFQYSIYNCFNDSIVYAKMISNEEDDMPSDETEVPAISWKDDNHYFSVFFPSLNRAIVSGMSFWIISSVVLLLVMVFFAYVISVILRQKRLSEIKNDFINNMTHELKTPISTIALSSDVLLGEGVEQNPERLKNYARIIKNENQRLQSQVERVLQVARLDKEDLQLKRELINIHELIELAVPTIQMNFEEKKVKIWTSLEADRFEIDADEMHITNIIYNLLDNAAKYSGEQPEIVVATTNNNKGIFISVSDNGPGIKKEHQRYVFEKFYRIPTGDVHDVKGFGLGLHYVKTITEAHHGKVTIKNKSESGCTFEVFLPFGTEFVKR